MGSPPEEPIGSAVRSFYRELPFNIHSDVGAVAESVRLNPIRSNYPDLHELLTSGNVSSVAEFGCGTGWLTCSLALHYGLNARAVDFTAPALERARRLAEVLGVTPQVAFTESDLFDYRLDPHADLVVSLGVLHHTRDCRAAFDHVQAQARRAVYVALYHEPGRRPFLEHFGQILEERGERAALDEYRRLDGIRASDEQHLESWFRDQVLHPHETQHTLREVCGWLQGTDLALQSTSINRFAQPLPPMDDLYALEDAYGDVSRRALQVERRYFPGFFTVLAERRNEEHAPR